MLCRPGMEDMMDRNFSPLPDGFMGDIWDAPGLYKIPGPNGHCFIHMCADNEGRYLFSFNMDGFNPFQLKQVGHSATVMGLYMVCLNLPPGERFKSENMFLVGIIPGPNEPSMEQINHFLKPLVNDLLESYSTLMGYITLIHGSTPMGERRGVPWHSLSVIFQQPVRHSVSQAHNQQIFVHIASYSSGTSTILISRTGSPTLVRSTEDLPLNGERLHQKHVMLK
jgi:hypothetical protein